MLPYILSVFLILSALFFFKTTVFAQVSNAPADGTWVNDSDVTFVGKVGARSAEFLDWTFQNYNWTSVGASVQNPNGQNPIAGFWVTIRNIVYAFFALFVLITAFIMIVTRGKNMTITKFIPRFIIIILLVTFSFALIQFIYQVTDAIQLFFLRVPGSNPAQLISSKNLLNIGFDYASFVGYRVYGSIYDEAAFMSLLLVKITAVTYYTMSGILLIRKIILWFFIIISPIFPLLLLYAPIRNTAKIWVGEFFRWLLYAPLFAVLLQGLVYVWQIGIPLIFTTTTSAPVVYPTAINILLGGPGQTLSLTNSVNNQNTFALYVVALLMLWVVIILPFLLLQIFLDYLKTFSLSENSAIRQLISSGSSTFLGKNAAGAPLPPPPLPSGHQPSGMARQIPFSGKLEIPEIRTQSITANMANLKSFQSDISRLTNLSVPTMRDIARFETASMSHDIRQHGEIARYHEALERISDPRKIGAPIERQKYTELKDKLVTEGQKGNQFANSILTAAATVSKTTSVIDVQNETARLSQTLQVLSNPNAAPVEKRQSLANLKGQLEKASQSGDPVATSVIAAIQKGSGDESLKQKLKEAKANGNSLASQILLESEKADLSKFAQSPFPVINRVQSVNLDDYEAVRKMWEENYQNMEPPKTFDSKTKGRKEWISSDIEKINQAISYLTSADPENAKKGMESVGNILPFLLIGGFSQTEVIAYLKAKLEAAKTVVSQIGKKEEDEDTMVGRESERKEKPKEMTTSEEEKPDGEKN